MTAAPLYPLLSALRLADPIWGGRRLAPWLDLPPPHPERIGEAWLVFDSNRVRNGPAAGAPIAELARAHGADLVGHRPFARYGADLPLLAKFIDAADRLSIQVHPADAYAHTVEAHTGFHGKTEAWYILAAEPGATVTLGLRRPTDQASFAAAVAAGTVEGMLAELPVAAGDLIFVPAGTIHAINAGILLFEIQQKSDLTYRVYDYGRRDARTGQPRELHVAKALAVSHLGPALTAALTPAALAPGRDLLVACPSFALERWQIAGDRAAATDPGSLEILTVVAGAARLIWAGGAIDLPRGAALLLPAALGAYALATDSATILRAYVPDLAALAAEVGPDRAAGLIFP